MVTFAQLQLLPQDVFGQCGLALKFGEVEHVRSCQSTMLDFVCWLNLYRIFLAIVPFGWCQPPYIFAAEFLMFWLASIAGVR